MSHLLLVDFIYVLTTKTKAAMSPYNPKTSAKMRIRIIPKRKIV